jgi:hypothetical protein
LAGDETIWRVRDKCEAEAGQEAGYGQDEKHAVANHRAAGARRWIHITIESLNPQERS